MPNYTENMLDLTKLAIDLAVENDYYRQTHGAILDSHQSRSFAAAHRVFEPVLEKVGKSSILETEEAQRASEAIQEVIQAIQSFRSSSQKFPHSSIS